jgi:hypothetical protein
MNCPEFDLKGYLLKELPQAEACATEEHAKGCAACREEMERLSVTLTALRAAPEEELPRRIAFVSDKVFEPRWWQVWLNSGPRMAFVSSSLVAAAILLHGVDRPAPAPVVDTAAIEARVQQAVAESEARQAGKIQAALAAAEKRFEFERQIDRVQIQETFDVMRKQMTPYLVARADPGDKR